MNKITMIIEAWTLNTKYANLEFNGKKNRDKRQGRKMRSVSQILSAMPALLQKSDPEGRQGIRGLPS